jgi:hypothetical protein
MESERRQAAWNFLEHRNSRVSVAVDVKRSGAHPYLTTWPVRDSDIVGVHLSTRRQLCNIQAWAFSVSRAVEGVYKRYGEL